MTGMILIVAVISYFLYAGASYTYRNARIQSTESILRQTRSSLEDYLLSMRNISDAIYYNVIQESTASYQELDREMSLLYESHRNSLVSVALYNAMTGSLLASAPVAQQKEDPDVTAQTWFMEANREIENQHFSRPHIQNLFDDGSKTYHWVISLSRQVEIPGNAGNSTGVLLADMDFSNIVEIIAALNDNTSGQYYYLCDERGDIIYHPRKMLLDRGLFEENAAEHAAHSDGTFTETFNGRKRIICKESISYTGWKLISVMPQSTPFFGVLDIRLLVLFFLSGSITLILLIGRIVSTEISSPILKLNDSVAELEAGEKPEIYYGGPKEIRHLSASIQNSYQRIDRLMQEIVREQTMRRKNEIDALQSQINPHFLYNTLDSITWMIEGGKGREAEKMISELARLLRISLSKGRTIISIRDELQHATSYMGIQRVRYRDRFAVVFDISPEIEDCCTVKLILQPLLENAIYYGVGDMDEDDGGEIRVTGGLEDGLIRIRIQDNGLGMTEEEAALVLTDSTRVHKHGSGVGLVNVEERIQLLFGEPYGLKVESEPDVGTAVTITLPRVPFTEENRKMLENGEFEKVYENLEKEKN